VWLLPVEAENQSGRASMQTAAKNSLVLTDSSSLKRFADIETTISYGGFYQLFASGLIRSGHIKQVVREVLNRLVVLAEHSYALRQMSTLEKFSEVLVNSPLPRQYEPVGRYYQALCIQRFGSGDVEQAARLLESAAEDAPPRYRARAMQSLGTNSCYKGDYQSALLLYSEAARFASRSEICDPYATLGTQKMTAVINSLEGNHRDAVAMLEKLFPFAHAMRSSQPSLYYDYLNSFALELCEVGRLEEANNISRIVVASPFASAYPEYRETRDEIELRGWRAPRSVVALSQITAGAALGEATDSASLGLAPHEGGNLLRLPVVSRSESLAAVEASPARQPARVLSLQEWKEKMAKQSNGDPQDKKRRSPATGNDKEARLEEVEKLGTRGMLLRAMEMLADDDLTDDQLRRVLIILEGLEPDENPGA
jgi:hypothetical protein